MYKIATLVLIGIVLGAVVPVGVPKYVGRTDEARRETKAAESHPVVQDDEGSSPSQSSRVRVSWYGVREYCEKYNPKCIMANRQKLDDNAFTAACSSRWKLGDLVAIRYQGKTIIVTCADRGSFEGKYGRHLDLTKAAFSALAPLSRGVIEVEVL